MKKKILGSLLALGMAVGVMSSTALAEIKTCEGVGEYIMSDFETPDVAKQRAKAYAERAAQEKAGVYVESYSKTENMVLVADEISTMTGGIMNVVKVDYEAVPLKEAGGLMYRATVLAQIDTAKVDEWLAKGAGQRSELVAQNRELQKLVAEQEKQIAQLKAAVKTAKTPAAEEKIKEEFAAADRLFLSNQKLEEGNRLNLVIADWAYAKAVECWTEAIELNPGNYLAYEARGYYFNLGDVARYQEAINDFTQAIRLNPANAANYYFRGTARLSLGNTAEAEADFERTIEMAPQMSEPYGELAYIYANRDSYLDAIDYATKAIELNERNWRGYYSRSLAFYKMGALDRAQADGERALELGCGEAYGLLGHIYEAKGYKAKAAEYLELAKDPPAFG